MTIYYQHSDITLYHGDCRENAEWRAADVLVTDPPYGIAYRGQRKDLKPIAGDQDHHLRDDVLALWGDKPAVVFGRWDVPRPAATRARLIWDKGDSPGMGDCRMPWGRSEEEIYVLGAGFSGRRTGNVLRSRVQSSGDKTRPNHPTPKPVSLMELILSKCPPGVVADPFAGAGATLIAAQMLGRAAIGVEVEEQYCEIIATRLSQGSLFAPAC